MSGGRGAPDGSGSRAGGSTSGRVLTERLLLAPPTAADVPALASAVYADPRTWALDPSLRRPPEELPGFVARLAERWARDGAGCWVVRLRPPAEDRHDDEKGGTGGGGRDGEVIGLGGCDLPGEGRAWNLFFRLAPAHQGRGFAQEVGCAGLAAAQRVRPDLPVTAFAAEANTPSRRTIERLGLAEAWRGPDRRSPDPGAVVVLSADRPLPPDLLRTLTS